jgi:hypothetical protein
VAVHHIPSAARGEYGEEHADGENDNTRWQAAGKVVIIIIIIIIIIIPSSHSINAIGPWQSRHACRLTISYAVLIIWSAPHAAPI